MSGRTRFGSVRLRFGGGTVRAVPVLGSGGSSAKKVFFFFSVFQYSLTGKDGSGSGFGSWKTVPVVPVPLSVSGKTVSAKKLQKFIGSALSRLKIRCFFLILVRVIAQEASKTLKWPSGCAHLLVHIRCPRLSTTR